jgi:hypothetical protein
MQVQVIAVQNAVDYRHLGAATSGATFFRSIGGSFGTAVFCLTSWSRLHSLRSSRSLELSSSRALNGTDRLRLLKLLIQHFSLEKYIFFHKNNR